jgi:hypothetical protein
MKEFEWLEQFNGNLDADLLSELAEAHKNAEAEMVGPFREVFQDGTAKPPPAPEAVRALTDRDSRERAEGIWYHCYRLAGLRAYPSRSQHRYVIKAQAKCNMAR